MCEIMGYRAKRVYPGDLGLYLEFYSESDAQAYYYEGLELGNRVERNGTTVIMKNSEEVLRHCQARAQNISER